MTYFQNAFAILFALVLSVTFARAFKSPTMGPPQPPGPGPTVDTEGGIKGGPSTPPPPTNPHAPKKKNVSTTKSQSMQKLTPDKTETKSGNIGRSSKH